MKKKLLRPNQILTLRDYPVHNEQILRLYFRMFNKGQGKIVPPCPVIHKDVVIPIMKRKFKSYGRFIDVLVKFLDSNPKIKYFLIDGSHKTSAATLAHKLIPVVVIENNFDLKQSKSLIESGEILGWFDPPNSVEDIVMDLTKHHSISKNFLTVEDKVNRMVKDKILPRYMIAAYTSGPTRSKQRKSSIGGEPED